MCLWNRNVHNRDRETSVLERPELAYSSSRLQNIFDIHVNYLPTYISAESPRRSHKFGNLQSELLFVVTTFRATCPANLIPHP
jgi:hypothetical protein